MGTDIDEPPSRAVIWVVFMRCDAMPCARLPSIERRFALTLSPTISKDFLFTRVCDSLFFARFLSFHLIFLENVSLVRAQLPGRPYAVEK